MSPGGDYEAYQKVEPYLKEWAAKAKDGSPCVEWVGPHGAGHYVVSVASFYVQSTNGRFEMLTCRVLPLYSQKMVHNGIEQGQLSILAEVWSIMHRTLEIPNEDIKDIFNSWNETGELSDDFLVDLGAHILSFNVSSIQGTANHIVHLNNHVHFAERGRPK